MHAQIVEFAANVNGFHTKLIARLLNMHVHTTKNSSIRQCSCVYTAVETGNSKKKQFQCHRQVSQKTPNRPGKRLLNIN